MRHKGETEQATTDVGIDAAKAWENSAARPKCYVRRFDYDESGTGALAAHRQFLKSAPVMPVTLEFTGCMKVLLVSALAAASLPVVVVKSRQVLDFARANRQAGRDGRVGCSGPCSLRRGGQSGCAPSSEARYPRGQRVAPRRNLLMTMLVADRKNPGRGT